MWLSYVYTSWSIIVCREVLYVGATSKPDQQHKRDGREGVISLAHTKNMSIAEQRLLNECTNCGNTVEPL